MARPLEQRLRGIHKKAGAIATVLGNVQARVPGTFPENLDDMHKAIKRGELRRVLNCAQGIVDDIEIPIEPEGTLSPERLAKRAERQAARDAARTAKKKAKKKTTKKKTG